VKQTKIKRDRDRETEKITTNHEYGEEEEHTQHSILRACALQHTATHTATHSILCACVNVKLTKTKRVRERDRMKNTTNHAYGEKEE